MEAIGVDHPYQDTKTRKTSIERDLFVEVLDDGTAYLNVVLSCDETANEGIEVTCLRTAASSMIQNLKLVCQTIKEFGP